MTDAGRLQSLVGPVHAEHLFGLMRELPIDQQEPWLARLLRMLTTQDRDVVRLVRRKFPRVSVEEFITGKYYLNKAKEIYPVVMQELIKINSGKYDEIVLTGGIGSAKTTSAIYSQAFQVYDLSTYQNPHGVFGLDPSSEIKIVFQSLTSRLAKGVDYNRFKDMMQNSLY